jgi:hypothetical protein
MPDFIVKEEFTITNTYHVYDAENEDEAIEKVIEGEVELFDNQASNTEYEIER